MHQKQKDFADKLKENELKRNPFNGKINEQNLATATAYKYKNGG